MLLTGCAPLSALLATPTPVPTPRDLIVGKWERVTARKISPPFSAVMPDQIEFLKDGTWVVPGTAVVNGKYSFLEPARIKVEGSIGIVFMPAVSITPSGGSMVLTEVGEPVEYRRK
jgi:hypothetical protein